MRRLLLALLLLVPLSTACGVHLKAEHVTLRIRDNTIELAIPRNRPVRSGEVVITIENYTFAKRQIVLARTDLDPTTLPVKLATALRGRDHKSVVSVTASMRPAKTALVGLLPATVASSTTLHVHLHRGARYLVFDRLGGLALGESIALVAG